MNHMYNILKTTIVMNDYDFDDVDYESGYQDYTRDELDSMYEGAFDGNSDAVWNIDGLN